MRYHLVDPHSSSLISAVSYHGRHGASVGPSSTWNICNDSVACETRCCLLLLVLVDEAPTHLHHAIFYFVLQLLHRHRLVERIGLISGELELRITKRTYRLSWLKRLVLQINRFENVWLPSRPLVEGMARVELLSRL